MKSHHPQIKVFPVEIVERGLELVQTAHQLQLKTQVKVFHKKLRISLGNYGKSVINIDSTRSNGVFGFIHELGHHLDFAELGTKSHKPCSTERGSPLSRLVKLMRASKVYHTILTDKHLSNYKRRYFASAVELWARGYSQFVIRRCINAGIKINHWSVMPYQWEDEDFDPIHAEIMAIFSAKGWV